MTKKKAGQNQYLTWVEIDLKAVQHNLKALQKLTEKNRFTLPHRPAHKKLYAKTQYILSVVKANAYGHGVEKISALLNRQGIGFFGVSDVKEGKQLREWGIKQPILLLESSLPEFAKDIVDYQLMPTVCTLELAKTLNNFAKKRKTILDIHVLVDTGMGRLGIWHEEAYDFVKEIYQLKNLRTMGIMTHFPAADSDKIFTKAQIHDLHTLIKKLDNEGMIIPFIHAANSMGLAGYKTNILNLARPGLMLYGMYPHPSLKRQIHLKPVMSVKSRIIFLKDVPKGRSISYGRTFFTKKAMKVATLPIGYNDGYFRAFSNKAHVLVNGTRCPVIGRVTMDQIMIDVTHASGVKLGSTAVILGEQKKHKVSADELADIAGTINYEIVCSLGNRLPHVFK